MQDVRLRLIADDAGMASDLGVTADPLTEKQYLEVRESTVTAFHIARALYKNAFLRCGSVDEFLALIALIESEL